MKKNKWIVKWFSTLTGQKGYGQPTSKTHAEAAAENGNNAFPHIVHTAEEVKDERPST